MTSCEVSEQSAAYLQNNLAKASARPGRGATLQLLRRLARYLASACRCHAY